MKKFLKRYSPILKAVVIAALFFFLFLPFGIENAVIASVLFTAMAGLIMFMFYLSAILIYREVTEANID